MKIDSAIVVITGGASGLGEGAARDLVKQGARVAILDLNEENGVKVSQDIGPDCLFVKTDITSEGAPPSNRISAICFV